MRPATSLRLRPDPERSAPHQAPGVMLPLHAPRRQTNDRGDDGHSRDVDQRTEPASQARPRASAGTALWARRRARLALVASRVPREIVRRDVDTAGALHRRRQRSTSARSPAGGRRRSSSCNAMRSRTARERRAWRRPAHERQSPCSVSSEPHVSHAASTSSRFSDEARARGGWQGFELTPASVETIRDSGFTPGSGFRHVSARRSASCSR